MKKKLKRGKNLTIFSIKKNSIMEGQPNELPLTDKGVIKRVGQKLAVAASSPEKNNLHIIARGEHWIIKREGAQKAYRICETQEQAVEDAKEIINKGLATHIIIHEDDGTVAKRI